MLDSDFLRYFADLAAEAGMDSTAEQLNELALDAAADPLQKEDR